MTFRKKKKILIVGDILLDEYIRGSVTRLSPEAPVPVLKQERVDRHLGGAANVAANVVALGAQADLCGIIGTDAGGDEIIRMLREKKIQYQRVVRISGYTTPIKKRLMCGSHQICRYDIENDEWNYPVAMYSVPIYSGPESKGEKITIKIPFRYTFFNTLRHVSAIIVSDYRKKTITSDVMRAILRFAIKKHIPVIVDAKPENVDLYTGVTVAKMNHFEADRISKVWTDIPKRISAAVLITQGRNGMKLITKSGIITDIPGRPVAVADSTGAGDTAGAVLALALANRRSLIEAARMANIAGSLVVQKSGTATISLDELRREMKNA